ncbi:hypothetical protein Afil01_13070 [Actinorhabdospora filicis]|uniref:Ricin B lectin domain-containing protein n=1 Tax=Actinorhabdospora filicis TaxID=1785913 RepID=A0A9W6SIB9_9ACTN|nr:hypothetical protein [Actinorhabdospora filicis]GLZ76500.1 hypothetical protein Afil01_13070 [Actinorhabdospora filicis]
MDGRWRGGGPHMPDLLRRAFRGGRRRAGSARAVALTAGLVAVVLIVAVVAATVLPDADPAPPAGAGAAETGSGTPSPPTPGSSPSASPSASPPASPSTSPSASKKPDPGPTGKKEEEKQGEAASGPSYPDGGTYRIRTGHTGLCLGFGPEPGNEGRTVLVQDDCSHAGPALSMTKLSSEKVRFTMYWADSGWSACLGQDSPGELYSSRGCDGGGLQTFLLVPAGDAYLIKSQATGECMDFPWDGRDKGAQAGAQPCASGSSSQRFSFT